MSSAVHPAVTRTRDWLERFVIGLGLCPFAAAPYRADAIAYHVADTGDPAALYRHFVAAVEDLLLADPDRRATALLIVLDGLEAFDDYLAVLDDFEQALAQAGLDGVVQLASFHPAYRFADSPADDPANYSNRSPYPMFHLLREDQLGAALAGYPDPAAIPVRNVARLRALGLARVAALAAGD